MKYLKNIAIIEVVNGITGKKFVNLECKHCGKISKKIKKT